MGEYKKLNTRVFGRKKLDRNPDVFYWKKLGVPVFLKEFGPVDYIDFCPIEPYYFAVTSSVRVQVYSPVTRLLYKNLSRFQKSAYGGSFRQDGKLLCAGGEENEVKLFDVSSKTLLRVFKGHEGPVHRCYFTVNNTHLVSFSDDQAVTFWDIPSEKSVFSYKEHTDYVRAGAVSPLSPDIVLSGGYDNYVKMYDKRVGSAVFNLNHGAPVESVLFLPTGGIFLSAGGTEIKVWSALQAGKLIAQFHNHHKTVTCLRLASNGSRILSGSLDRHVNVYDITSFKRLHTIDYPNAVLSLGISANDETLAVGMVDGLISVNRRETTVSKPTTIERKRNNAKYSNAEDSSIDRWIFKDVHDKGGYCNRYLQKFEFTKALTFALKARTAYRYPHVTVAVLRELIARRVIHVSIAGYNTPNIVRLLTFLIKFIGDYRFTRVLIVVANAFLDVYEDSIAQCGHEAVIRFKALVERISEEVSLTESLLMLEGSATLMISAANAGTPQTAMTAATNTSTLTQSESGKEFVVHVN